MSPSQLITLIHLSYCCTCCTDLIKDDLIEVEKQTSISLGTSDKSKPISQCHYYTLQIESAEHDYITSGVPCVNEVQVIHTWLYYSPVLEPWLQTRALPGYKQEPWLLTKALVTNESPDYKQEYKQKKPRLQPSKLRCCCENCCRNR